MNPSSLWGGRCATCFRCFEGVCQPCGARGVHGGWRIEGRLWSGHGIEIHDARAPDGGSGTVTRFVRLKPRLARILDMRFLRSQQVDSPRFAAPEQLVFDGPQAIWIQRRPASTPLAHLGRQWSARQAALAGAQLFEALADLHRHGLVHGQVDAGTVATRRDTVDVRLGGLPPLVMQGWSPSAAPEVTRGQMATSRTDIYGAGQVVARRVAHRSLPDLLHRCVAPEPSDRPGDAFEVAAALRRWAAQQQPSWRERLRWGA